LKVMVTGGTGMIGSNLVRRLLDEGRSVVVAADMSSKDIDNLSNLGVQSSQIEIRQADLSDNNQALSALKGVQVVYHLAARIGSMEYLHGSKIAELATLQTNFAIDSAVFKACLEHGVETIIYASSCAVYPLIRQRSYTTFLTESSLELGTRDYIKLGIGKSPGLIDPDGGYGWAKLMGELQLNWMKDIRVGIARIFNVYGENERIGSGAHVIGDFIVNAIRYPESDFIVHGTGRQSRDYVYVSDCIDALIRLEAKASNPPLTVNVGSGEATTIAKLAETIARVSGKNIIINYDGIPAVGPRSRTADTLKANTTIGLKPTVSLDNGLRRTYKDIYERIR
jgi:GDP-D-mannose 3', 5'-epimerase